MRKASIALTVFVGLGVVAFGGGSASATECPAGAAAISGLSFSVNGSPASMSGLVISGVVSGAVVTASFTIAPGCTAVPLNFSAYNAVAAQALPGNVGLQTLNSNASGTFAAGPHTLSITVPSCFFQVDMYRGPLVSQWTMDNLLSFFAGTTFNGAGSVRQMLGNATGGVTPCQSGGQTTLTTPPSNVLGAQTTPGQPAPGSVTAPVVNRSAGTTPVTTISGLPSTSTTPFDAAAPTFEVLGLALIALGASLVLRKVPAVR